jgi:hypothetical protein
MGKAAAVAEAMSNYFDVKAGEDAIAFLVAQKERYNEDKNKKADYEEVSKGEVRLSEKLLEAGNSDHGALNKKQFEILGIGWPPKSGWKQRLIGTVMDKENYEEFLSYTNDHLTALGDEELDISDGVIDYLQDLTSNTQKRINHLKKMLDRKGLGKAEKQVIEAKIVLLKEFIPHFSRIQSRLTNIESKQ